MLALTKPKFYSVDVPKILATGSSKSGTIPNFSWNFVALDVMMTGVRGSKSNFKTAPAPCLETKQCSDGGTETLFSRVMNVNRTTILAPLTESYVLKKIVFC